MDANDNIYVTKVMKPPTYIRNLTKNDDEIILVHSKVRNIQPASPNESLIIPGEHKDETTLLDITGSPLKTSFNNSLLMQKSLLEQCETNWNIHEESHFPLTLKQARKYVTDYFADHTSSKVVWCVCDGEDADRTVLIAVQKNQNYINSTIVKLLGYLPENLKDEHFHDLNKKHDEVITKFDEKNRESCSFYEIYGSPIYDSDKEMKTAKKGYVTLKVCEGVQNNITLGVQVLVGHPHAPSAQLWDDLLRLELYINLFSQYANSDQMRDGFWFPASNPVDSQDPIHLASRIVHERDIQSAEYKERTKDMIHVVENVFERETLDITDKLWSVLVRCSSYEMLVDCLNVFLMEIAHNRNKVYIADGNDCWVARLLKGIISGVTVVPTFTGTQPMQFLIMLGIEKLRKDYIHIFTQTNVLTEEQINSYLSMNKNEKKNLDTKKFIVVRDTQLIDIDQITLETTVLGRLEALCELLCLVPQDWLKYVSDAAVHQFLSPKLSPISSFTSLAANHFYELNATLPARAVIQHESVSNLVQVTKSIESLSSHLKMFSLLHMSLRPIFPPCIYQEEVENKKDVSVIKMNACYHYTTLHNTVHYFG